MSVNEYIYCFNNIIWSRMMLVCVIKQKSKQRWIKIRFEFGMAKFSMHIKFIKSLTFIITILCSYLHFCDYNTLLFTTQYLSKPNENNRLQLPAPISDNPFGSTASSLPETFAPPHKIFGHNNLRFYNLNGLAGVLHWQEHIAGIRDIEQKVSEHNDSVAFWRAWPWSCA